LADTKAPILERLEEDVLRVYEALLERVLT
jgi:hypothetical protein